MKTNLPARILCLGICGLRAGAQFVLVLQIPMVTGPFLCGDSSISVAGTLKPI